jgi:hypothetical protein
VPGSLEAIAARHSSRLLGTAARVYTDRNAAVPPRRSGLTPELTSVEPVRSVLTQAALDFAQATKACGLHPAHARMT